jgi:hypothetical protein
VKTLTILSLTGLLVLLAAVVGHQPPSVAVQNRSETAVERFEIDVDGETVLHGSLAAGALDRHSLPVRKEGPMRLVVRFAGGRSSEFDVGWFNPGQSSDSHIAILSADSVRVRAW